MMLGLKPYREMKDSGVTWLGDVPVHWEVQPALAVYRPRLVKNLGLTEKTVLSLSYGRIVIKPEEKLRGLVPESFETYQIVEPGNIIIRTTDLQNDQKSLRIGHAKDRGIITSAYLCVETTNKVENEFGYQYLNAYDLLKIIYGYGSGLRQNLDFKDIKRMPVLVPPKDEQAAIVRFLDHADRRIRRAIAAKQKLIRLLEEQKQAIVYRAVTRGLDPDVRLKPSGVEWLRDVPEHWEVLALRHRYTQVLGKMLDTKRVTGSFLVPYLRNTDVQWDCINVQDLPTMDIRPSEYERYTVKPGDLLVCEGGEVGRCAIWSGAIDVCGYQKALHRLRPLDSERDISRYLRYVLRAGAKANAFNEGRASTIPHLTGDKLRAQRFAFPPPHEQRAIADAIDQKVAQIEASKANEERAISLLVEYRTRLIADIVTGKLDVREAATQLPEPSELEIPGNEGLDPAGDEETAPDEAIAEDETA